MKGNKTDTVSFTVKGQVVIPQWLRKQFDITKGTRAVVWPEGDHIALRPVTARFIRSLRGSLPGKRALRALKAGRAKEREL